MTDVSRRRLRGRGVAECGSIAADQLGVAFLQFLDSIERELRPEGGEVTLLGATLSLTCFVSHVTSPGLSASRNLEIATEIRRNVAQLVERPRLQLTSPLVCHAQFPSYLDERLRTLPR